MQEFRKTIITKTKTKNKNQNTSNNNNRKYSQDEQGYFHAHLKMHEPTIHGEGGAEGGEGGGGEGSILVY